MSEPVHHPRSDRQDHDADVETTEETGTKNEEKKNEEKKGGGKKKESRWEVGAFARRVTEFSVSPPHSDDKPDN